jgi:hypothetical protein
MELPIWSAVGAGAGVFFFFRGFGSWRRLRLIEDTPTSRVRSMSLGRVELAGRAQEKADLMAPLTASPCVYYRYRIEQEVGSGRNRRWKTLAKGDSSAWAFYLEDETGRVPIDPRGAEVDIASHWRETNPALGPHLRDVMGRHGIASHGLIFRKKLRFTEWRIAPGAPVYVLGVAQERPGLVLERRRRIAEKLAALKRDPDAMAHLDTDGDGRVSAEEWEVARRLVVQEIETQGFEDRVVVGAAPEGEAPFYITDRGEERVRSRHRLRCFAGIFGGAILALTCAGVLLRYLGLLGRF